MLCYLEHNWKGWGKGWRKLTWKRHLPVHRTCNYPWCIHIRTWLDERGVSDSRYVIGKGKRMVIDPFQQHAAACRRGNMATLTSASVWQVRCLCAGQSCCILVPSHPCCFQNRAHPFCIHHLLLLCQLCCCVPETSAWWDARHAVCRTIGLSFHFHMIDGSPPKACL